MRRNRSFVIFHEPPVTPPLPVSASGEEETDAERNLLHMHSHRAFSLPVREEQYESYGFIQVSEEQEQGSYPLKRSKSTNSIDREESLFKVNRNLERQLRLLQHEVQRLKKTISLVEETNDRWGARYSRQVSVFANATVGAWLWADRFLRFFGRRKGSLLSQVVGVAPGRGRPLGGAPSFDRMLLQALRSALQSSAPLLLAAYLLSRQAPWKRTAGSVLSLVWSLYLAVFSRFHPWTNYFLMLSALLYLTASYHSPANGVPTLSNGADRAQEYNQEEAGSASP